MKYHHFRKAVSNGILKVVRVDTTNQSEDIFAKQLARLTLEHLRSRIMRWTAMLSHSHLNTETFQALRQESIGC